MKHNLCDYTTGKSDMCLVNSNNINCVSYKKIVHYLVLRYECYLSLA